MKVIVGLGNPGERYRQTRHNVGFLVVGELARRRGEQHFRQKFDAEIVETSLNGEKLVLAAPLTYMNESGRAVRQIVNFYQLPLENLLIICDDLNLETGRLRLRPGGSSGGQKGLEDIIHKLGTEQFPRLRIGIGRPPGRMEASDYVLGKFTEAEWEKIEPAIQEAADGAELWARSDITTAMNSINAPRES